MNATPCSATALGLVRVIVSVDVPPGSDGRRRELLADREWREHRANRGRRHDDANAGVAVDSRRLDVQRRAEQRALHGRCSRTRLGGPYQRGERRRVRGCGGRAEERIQAAGELRGDNTVGSREIDLRERHAAVGREQEVAGGDGCAIRLIEELARAVGTEGLDGVRHAAHERSAAGRRHVDGRHRQRGRRIVAIGAACRRDGQRSPMGVEPESARGAGILDDDDQRVGRARRWRRSPRLPPGPGIPVCAFGRCVDDRGSGGIEHVQIVVVRRAPETDPTTST